MKPNKVGISGYPYKLLMLMPFWVPNRHLLLRLQAASLALLIVAFYVNTRPSQRSALSHTLLNLNYILFGHILLTLNPPCCYLFVCLTLNPPFCSCVYMARFCLDCTRAVSPACGISHMLGSCSPGRHFVYDPYLSTELVSCSSGHRKVTSLNPKLKKGPKARDP